MEQPAIALGIWIAVSVVVLASRRSEPREAASIVIGFGALVGAMTLGSGDRWAPALVLVGSIAGGLVVRGIDRSGGRARRSAQIQRSIEPSV